MLYLWNKLVYGKCSLISEWCAVKSAHRTRASFLLPKEPDKHRATDETSFDLLLRMELPATSRCNSSHRSDGLFFCCYLKASVYSHTNADKLWSGVYPYQTLQSLSSPLSPSD